MTDEFDVTIEYLNESGDGVARVGRRSFVTVPFTIPGERVLVALDGHRRDVTPASATLVEVLRASPHRVVPGCRHFGPADTPTTGCGGCTWQHISYPEQLRLKSALVARLLEAALQEPPAVQPTLAGTAETPWNYRHKVHFVFGNAAAAGRRSGALVMGHYARGSRRIVPVSECPVHDPRGNRIAFDFFDAFAKAAIKAATMVTGSARGPQAPGVLRSVAIRVARHKTEAMATLVVSDERDPALRSATRRAMNSFAAPTSLHLNIHPRGDAYIFGRETRNLIGPARLREQVAETAFLISPTAFFQTNVHAAEVMVQLVLDAVPAGAQVLDLYAGAGLFALPLARRGHRVIAVEDNRAAVADGEASARLNRISPQQCRFVARPVEAALGSIRTADAVVLDPPREGCAPGVIETVLGDLNPARVVYVSCNPQALARDLQTAASFPYTIDTVQPVDMFPHTAHVETVVTLSRAV